MLHGRLLDPHGEFFVARGSENQGNAGSTNHPGNRSLPNSWNAWASSAWDSAPWEYDDSGSFQKKNAQTASSTTLSRTQGRLEQEEHEWHNAFVLRVSALPLSYLPASLAQQILFVGKAVRTLRRGTSSFAPSVAARQECQIANFQLRLTDEEVASFEKALEALKAASHFHLLSFEALVKSLHATVAERLWRLIMEEADLVKHLRAVRDLVLMGHGALWHEIIVQGRDLMRHPPTTRSEESLRTGPLAAARRRCGMDEDHHAAARLRVVLALESFSCRHFDTLVGFALQGCYRHDRDTRAVLLAPQSIKASGTMSISESQKMASRTRELSSPQTSIPSRRWHRSGTLVSRGKKKVRKSFASIFKFTWAPAGATEVGSNVRIDSDGTTVGAAAALRGGSVHVSLVIQNELKRENIAGRLTDSAQGSFDGVTGVPNSFAVVLELDHAGAHLCLRLSDKNVSSATHPDPSASHHLPTILDIVQLPRRPSPNITHSLLVEYDASNVAAPTLRVYLDDPHKQNPPTMSTTVIMHKMLLLDVGAGDAAEVKIHAGVSVGGKDSVGGMPLSDMAALSSVSQNEISDLLPAVSIIVHEWSFAVRSDTQAPPPEAKAAAGLPNVSIHGEGTAGRAHNTRDSDGLSFSSSIKSMSPHKSAVDRFLDAQASWDELTVEYEISWPLHLILTTEATIVYNKIFSILWATKRTQTYLELCWPILMESRYRRLPQNDNVWLRPLQTLHASMLFFVKNFQVGKIYLRFTRILDLVMCYMMALCSCLNLTDLLASGCR